MNPTLTVSLTVEQLLEEPFPCVLSLFRHGKDSVSPEFLAAAYHAERTGRCRHPILDYLRPLQPKTEPAPAKMPEPLFQADQLI